MRPGAEIAVIGAGVVGLSTAAHLLDLGLSVRVYERGTPGCEQSAGAARIFQHAHDDPRLVGMATASRRIYRRWQERFGIDLLAESGALILGDAAPLQAQVLERAGGIPHRMVDDPSEHLPLLRPGTGAALLDESAGLVHARSVIDALGAGLGGRLVTEDVLAVRPIPGGVEVRCAAEVTEHSRVVVCAGRGTAALARGLGVSLPVQLGIQVRLTFAVREASDEVLPCFQDSSGVLGEAGAYGVALPASERYAVGLTDTARVRPDGSVEDPAELEELVRRTIALVSEQLPGLDPEPVEQRACWTTTLPWSSRGIAVWDADGVLLPVGHHLFKHAPALGEALAIAAAGKPLPSDLAPSAQLGLPPSS